LKRSAVMDYRGLIDLLLVEPFRGYGIIVV
jgi:hypothetical protein